MRWILVSWMWLPWGYIMGPEPDFTRRIPGLKIETWGTRPISSSNSHAASIGYERAAFYL